MIDVFHAGQAHYDVHYCVSCLFSHCLRFPYCKGFCARHFNKETSLILCVRESIEKKRPCKLAKIGQQIPALPVHEQFFRITKRIYRSTVAPAIWTSPPKNKKSHGSGSLGMVDGEIGVSSSKLFKELGIDVINEHS
ncbi:hypothetical protein HYS50_01605 [Candidatus Woesearchaeota archaeon]|nr:hypothetical protein [Candidatus Woesearchaeota archaeon]